MIYGPEVGYFTDGSQTVPVYDPPHDGPCIVCRLPLSPDNVKTPSLMWADRTGDVCAFYRVHRTCYEENDMELYEGSILDAITSAALRTTKEGEHG